MFLAFTALDDVYFREVSLENWYFRWCWCFACSFQQFQTAFDVSGNFDLFVDES